jgi:hypothetical protein
MKRRDLLVGGAATLGVSTQAAATTVEPTFDPAAVEASLAKIDQRMASFAQLQLRPHEPRTADEARLFDERGKVARAALRTLYFTGAFMEFEEHDRAHPGVQARMLRLQPEMDEAVDGMAGFLESLTPADHRNLQAELKRDPHLGMKVGEQLNQVAKEDGFGFTRRADLRLAVDDFSRRMQAQNPALVIDPYVRKTRKIQANPGTLEEREREFQVRTGEKAFWELQQRSARYLATWDRTYSNRPRIDLASLEENYPGMVPPEDPTGAPKRLMKIGGYLMGAGLGTAALGGICYLISASSTSLSGFAVPAIVLGVTIGPGLLVGGLVVLIIGGIWYAIRKPDEDAQPAIQAPQPPTPQASPVAPADPNRPSSPPPPPDNGPPPSQL